MKIAIVGGGKVGYYLCEVLSAKKYKVRLIEKKFETCEKIANKLNIPVTRGRGTDVEALRSAEVDECDMFIAVTGHDEDNFVACQLAKTIFGVKRTIARSNNPKNGGIIEKLGVDIAVSSTALITEIIEREVLDNGVKTLIKLQKGKASICQLELPDGAHTADKALKELKMPKNCLITAVLRNDETIIPNGDTILRSRDILLIMSLKKDNDDLKRFFIGKIKSDN